MRIKHVKKVRGIDNVNCKTLNMIISAMNQPRKKKITPYLLVFHNPEQARRNYLLFTNILIKQNKTFQAISNTIWFKNNEYHFASIGQYQPFVHIRNYLRIYAHVFIDHAVFDWLLWISKTDPNYFAVTEFVRYNEEQAEREYFYGKFGIVRRTKRLLRRFWPTS